MFYRPALNKHRGAERQQDEVRLGQYCPKQGSTWMSSKPLMHRGDVREFKKASLILTLSQDPFIQTVGFLPRLANWRSFCCKRTTASSDWTFLAGDNTF